MDRITISDYAAKLAIVCATRSEDPFKKVGAVAFTSENRVVATAYNGLAPGKRLTEEQWKDRDSRLKYVVHAEQNLCSLFKRGEVYWVMTTLCPCVYCLKLLDAHAIREVWYLAPYEREQVEVSLVAPHLNLHLRQYVPKLTKDESNIVSSCLVMGASEDVSKSSWRDDFGH